MADTFVLDRLLRPRSIAIIGASVDESGHAGRTVANLHAYHVGFLAAAGVALLAAVAALTVHDEDAASTMVPRHRGADDARRAEPALSVEA